jgi:hypothetical protein
MPIEHRFRQLVEEAMDSDRTPDEVCRDCPELLGEVRWVGHMRSGRRPTFMPWGRSFTNCSPGVRRSGGSRPRRLSGR